VLDKAETAAPAALEPTFQLAPEPPRPPEPAPSLSNRLRFGLGGTMLAVATGGAALSASLYHDRQDKGAAYRSLQPASPGYLDAENAWLSARPNAYAALAPASVLASAGLDLVVLPYTDDHWWISIASGAGGLGLAAWGVGELLSGGPCNASVANEERFCAVEQQQRDRGGLLLLGSLPLLQLPVAHVIRSVLPDGDSPTTQVSFLPNPQRPGLHIFTQF